MTPDAELDRTPEDRGAENDRGSETDRGREVDPGPVIAGDPGRDTGDTGGPGEVTRSDPSALDAQTFDDRPLADIGEGRSRRTMEDGPTGHAPSTPSTGDPDAGDPVAGAEAGGVAGAVTGTGLGGPIGGFIGATLGGIAGAGAEAVDDEYGSPGREVREPYGHPVRVRDRRETARDARGDAPEEPRPDLEGGLGGERDPHPSPAPEPGDASDEDMPLT
jgi:hypothetical protein